MRKLTLVSFIYENRRVSLFIQCDVVDGKSMLPASVHDALLRYLGCNMRGMTYTIGG